MNSKMRNISVLLFLVIGFAIFGSASSNVLAASELQDENPRMEKVAQSESGTITYIVNTTDSTIRWLGEKVKGDVRFGTIGILEGSLIIEDGTLVSGSVVIEMTSIENENITNWEII